MVIGVDALKKTDHLKKYLTKTETDGCYVCPKCGASDGAYVFVSTKNPGVRLLYCPECKCALDLVGVVQCLFNTENRVEAIKIITKAHATFPEWQRQQQEKLPGSDITT